MHRIVLSSLLLLLTLPACDPDRRRNAQEADLQFHTSDDAELYFKNVRRRYYDHQDIPAAKLDVYRLSERSQNQDRPVINLAIAHNWRYDEAYLLIEPNETVGTAPPLQVVWQNRNDSTETGNIIWEEQNKLAQLQFATKLNSSIKSKHNLYLVTQDSARTPLFTTAAERETFQRTMFDYYRLTGTFNKKPQP